MNEMNCFTSILWWNISLVMESPLFVTYFLPFLCLGNYYTSFKAKRQIKGLIYLSAICMVGMVINRVIICSGFCLLLGYNFNSVSLYSWKYPGLNNELYGDKGFINIIQFSQKFYESAYCYCHFPPEKNYNLQNTKKFIQNINALKW